MRSFKIISCFFIALLVCSACSMLPTDRELEELNENELYALAKEQLALKHYSIASSYLNTLNSKYPYNKNSEFSTSYAIYTNFMIREYEVVFNDAEYFQKIYPQSDMISWVKFMQAYSLVKQTRSWTQDYLESDFARNDITRFDLAYKILASIIANDPASPYVAAAAKLQRLIVTILTEKEYLISKYYLEKNLPIAAANRVYELIRNYPNSCFIGDALQVLDASYDMLGLTSWSEQVRKVMRINNL